MDNTKLFSGKAEDYNKARPGYAKEFIEYLYNEIGFNENSAIADIGSGTGKFSKYLLEKGSKVFCVEPNEDMRKTAERELSNYSNFISVNGGADNTALNNNSVDFVTVAQAFHWFDVENFSKECIRILKPRGKVVLIWNRRDVESDLSQANYSVFKKYCPRFKGFMGGMKEDDDRIKNFFNNKYDSVSFNNFVYLDREKFIKRCLSASYSLRENEKEFEKFINELNYNFDKYAENNIVEMKNRTVGYIGEIC